MNDRIRCFIGVPVDHHLALALLGERDRAMRALAAARPREVEAANFHLTLAFLGDVAAERADALMPALETLAAGWRPFAQPLTRAACFPRGGSKLFAVEGEPVPEILTLAQQAGQMLHHAGIETEARRIRPHITLLRLGLSPVPAPEWEVGLALPVRELVLYESVPGQRWNDYLRRGSFPFGDVSYKS